MELPRLKTTYLTESGDVVEGRETLAELDRRFQEALEHFLDGQNIHLMELGGFRAVITWLPEQLPEGI